MRTKIDVWFISKIIIFKDDAWLKELKSFFRKAAFKSMSKDNKIWEIWLFFLSLLTTTQVFS